MVGRPFECGQLHEPSSLRREPGRRGDDLADARQQGKVTQLARADRVLALDPCAAFGEWASPLDQEAYGRL